jgi:hypothetical protein
MAYRGVRCPDSDTPGETLVEFRIVLRMLLPWLARNMNATIAMSARISAYSAKP